MADQKNKTNKHKKNKTNKHKTSKHKTSKQKRAPLRISAAKRLRRILGSWTFLAAQVTFIGVWMVANLWLKWDPSPNYLRLNLWLTVEASLAAVLVLVSERDK